MSVLLFEWHPAKAAVNRRKHGVSFELARRTFDDPDAISEQDRDQDGEPRWQTLGRTEGILLLVAHTVYEDGADEVIRIISARRADRKERRRYEKELKEKYG